jgi:phosphatidylinositol alpha-1,6-mannosyltransferase
MKILALVTDAFGGYGGIAQYNRDFLEALASLDGLEALHVLPRIAPEQRYEVPEGITQHKPIAGRMAYSFAALRVAFKLRPDIVICGHVYHGPLAVRIAGACGAKLTSQLHGTEVWKPLARKHLDPLVQSDLVFCVSRDTKSRYRAQAGNRSNNEVVIHNTVGDHFQSGDRSAARARFGISNETVILTVARLDERNGYKGHDRVIDVLPSLLIDGRNVVYLVAGVGNDRPRLERRAKDLGVAKFVRFLGKVPDDTMPDLYRAADLFALPSTGEGFGIVFVEAMACGTPAIGLNVGGAPDALGDGELGWCVSEADFPAALVRALDSGQPTRGSLPAMIRSRFGRAVFQRKIAQALSRLELARSRLSANTDAGPLVS